MMCAIGCREPGEVCKLKHVVIGAKGKIKVRKHTNIFQIITCR